MTTTKKLVELATEEKREMAVPVGFPGLPYPMVSLEKDNAGNVIHKVGAVESATKPLIVWSHLSVEAVNGSMFRSMPTPSMMLLQRDLLNIFAPDSKKRVMTVFGDPATGKSHMFKEAGRMAHPDGAISIDCGGMNMRELIWRTVIDYGRGVKEQLDQRAAAGKLQHSSIEALNEEFPGSVVQKDGKTLINWDAVGARRTEIIDGQVRCVEDRGDAMHRAKELLDFIYEKEGITVETNAFGIKTVPGELQESLATGRPIFLDEFNKSKKGTLDSFQTFLEFANGQKDTWTAINPMATSDEDDSPKSVTYSRDDIRVGWGVMIAGNDAIDGDTTQELSESMETRLNPYRLGKPTLADWKHRISQILTGVPVTTLHTLYEQEAKADAPGFSQWLMDLRKLDLSAGEVRNIPPHELEALKKWPETVEAVNTLTEFYFYRQQLSDTASEEANAKAELADELAARGRQIRVSFRTIIEDVNRAVRVVPDVCPAGNAKVSFNMAAAFAALDRSAIGQTDPAWYCLGKGLADALLESVAKDTVGMPLTRAAFVAYGEEKKVWAKKLEEGRESADTKTLADLLKFDDLEDLGSKDELLAMRAVIMAYLRTVNPGIRGDDENIIPLRSLGVAMKAVEERKADPAGFFLPNDNLDEVSEKPVVIAATKPSWDMEEGQRFVDYRAVLAGLAAPGYAEQNRARVWLSDISEFVSFETSGKKEKVTSGALMKIIEGKSDLNFGLSNIMVANANGDPDFLHMLRDDEKQRVMVVGPGAISAQLRSALAKNNMEYVQHGTENAIETVNAFLTGGARRMYEKGDLEKEKSERVISGLIQSFQMACGTNDVTGNAEGRITLGQLMHTPGVKPQIFVGVVR